MGRFHARIKAAAGAAPPPLHTKWKRTAGYGAQVQKRSLPPVIVLGLDTPVGLTAVRELGRHQVPLIGVAYHALSIGRGSRWLDSFLLRPEGPLADWLPGLIARTGAGAVLPMKDRDIVDLAALGETIAGCRNLGARAGPMALITDKTLTIEAARGCGIEVPGNWQPESAEEEFPELGWPVVLKWADPLRAMEILKRASIRDTKSEYCHDAAALRAALRRYDGAGGFPLVQSYCPGRGLGQTLYMEGGRATLRFQHERVHEWPPHGGVSSLCRAVPLDRHREQMALSEQLLAALGWEGFAMVEYRHDPATGRNLFMEVNGHLWGSLALTSACGAEFVWEAYRRQLLGQTDPAPPPRFGLSARDTVKETRRIVRVLFRPDRIPDPAFRRTPLGDLARYLFGFVDPRTRGYVFAWSDPVPLLWSAAGSVIRAARRLKERLSRRLAPLGDGPLRQRGTRRAAEPR